MEASALSPPAALGRLSGAGPLLRLRGDEQLVALFRAGHDEAFGVIHDRYRQRLFAYSRQMLGGSASDAEDVLQDVFLRAYHALRVDERPLSLRAWLYRVAHNRCIDQLRRPSPAASDIFDVNRCPAHDPSAEAERREDLRRLVEDVRRLPEQQRSALLMREMEGLTYAELAAALGVTVPAVKSLLVRARIGLVEAIEARDTACHEIRADIAEAFDRGVRASGRSRKHLRECEGCREYRAALRTVEKQLSGLAPGHGPLATIAKVLGIGGAGSGAAAGGGAAAAGGGATAAGGGGVVTLGGGAIAATATKVAAVVAAAAVVGGGAASVEHQVTAPAARHARPAAVVPAAAATAVTAAPRASARHLVAVLSGRPPGPAHAGARHAASRAVAPASAELAPDVAPVTSVTGDVQPADLVGTGGLRAPDDAATADPSAPTAAGSPGDGSTAAQGGATTGTGTGTGTTGGAGQVASSTGSSPSSSTSSTSSGSSATGTTATAQGTTSTTSTTTPGAASTPTSPSNTAAAPGG